MGEIHCYIYIYRLVGRRGSRSAWVVRWCSVVSMDGCVLRAVIQVCCLGMDGWIGWDGMGMDGGRGEERIIREE